MADSPMAILPLTRDSTKDLVYNGSSFDLYNDNSVIDAIVDSTGKVITYNNQIIALSLPSGYTRVPYLESSGTQFINTGYVPTASFKHILVFEITSTANSNKYICGSGVSEGRSGNLRLNASTLNGLYIGTSSSVSILTPKPLTIATNTKYTIIMNMNQNAENTVILNRTTISNTSTSTVVSTRPMYLFSLSASYVPTGLRIYSSKLDQGGKCKYHLIPAKRNSDNVLGMYDVIRKTFLTNAGSGTFITE